MAEEPGNPSDLARHVGTFGSQLFKHGEESSPKISLGMERKVAMSWLCILGGKAPALTGCFLPSERTRGEGVLQFIIASLNPYNLGILWPISVSHLRVIDSK